MKFCKTVLAEPSADAEISGAAQLWLSLRPRATSPPFPARSCKLQMWREIQNGKKDLEWLEDLQLLVSVAIGGCRLALNSVGLMAELHFVSCLT